MIIRQEINFLNQIISAAGGSSFTSNEIVQLNTGSYSGTNTYYFEVVGDSTVSISFNITARRKGTSTDDASCNIPLLSTTYTLVRSSGFTPPTGVTEYVVFIDATAGATKNCKAARLIVIQNGTIGQTETQIDIGNAQSLTTTTLTALTNPKYFLYTAANWSGATMVAYWETVLTSNDTMVTATAQLQVSDGTGDNFAGWAAVGSNITTTSATSVRVRSSSIALTAGRNYRVVYSSSTTKTAINTYNAKIIISFGGWSQVGSGLGIATVGIPALAALNSTDVAFIDNTNDNLRTYRFDGTNWAQVGNGLGITVGNHGVLAKLTSTDIAFIETTGSSLKTYRFDGTNWAQVGNALSIPNTGNPVLAGLNSTDVAFIDDALDSLRTYRFDGTNWAQVGNALSLAVNNPALAALNSTDVAFLDGGNDSLRTYRFDGTNWSQVGNGLSLAVTNLALAALNSTDVAFIDDTNDDLRTYRFDGTNWSQVGNGLGIATVGSPALAALNSTDVAFIDSTNDNLRTYRFDETTSLAAAEPQYLLANTLLAAGTGLQTFLTKWDSTEWSGVTNTYKFAVDAANGSTSVVEADTAAGTQITGSPVTSPDNQGISGAMTMPANGNLDCKATTNNGDVYGSRILVTVVAAADVFYPGITTVPIRLRH